MLNTLGFFFFLVTEEGEPSLGAIRELFWKEPGTWRGAAQPTGSGCAQTVTTVELDSLVYCGEKHRILENLLDSHQIKLEIDSISSTYHATITWVAMTRSGRGLMQSGSF